MKLSPMMQQYMDTKEQYKDCILFYRLGDFYEMFFEDAKLASKELELTLTGKSCGQDERAPMCGVPYHAAEGYIAKLVEKGYKVAIGEQMEDPATAKGLVKREVVRVVTPGTFTSQTILSEKENNYLAAICMDCAAMAVAYCDVSTGELNLTEYSGDGLFETLLNELVKIKAKEIIVSESFDALAPLDELRQVTEAYVNVLPDSYYSAKICEDSVKAKFNAISLAQLGLDFRPKATLALGVLLGYLMDTQKQNLKHLSRLNIYEIGMHMALDKATIRNLEITETLYEKKVQGSLLGVLDKTLTAMGSRRMRQWLREPLNDSKEINYRLDGVEELVKELMLRNNLREGLRQIYDFERLCGRISYGSANGKDLIALRNSIAVLPQIKEELSGLDSRILRDLDGQIDALDEVFERIESAIEEDPPFTVREGGLIKEGYSKELDELKFSISDAKTWISNLEGYERERTGIKNLKVGYNRVFGYYLEVTRSNYELIPDNYIRKQTLANAERFITPELKEMEGLVLNAETKINQLEYEIFTELRGFIQGYIDVIQATSSAVATLDALVSFAQVSDRLGYVKPEVGDGAELEIIKGRHPVIEQTVRDGLFVSNDTYVNCTDASMLLITGPNMAGKSTYMRQTALIVLMAQAGCFVPCERAKIGVVDRIFTRIGASDNLAQGQSTFFVEMSELSYILNNAKDRSLIILDEIGRGTSTYDGLSIAWATVEYLCSEKRRIRTLFATHYHELTVLSEELAGVRNLNVDVAEENGNIVFLHKIIEGSASRSYGIHVAKLAGIPKVLLDRAEVKLAQLEDGGEATCGGYGRLGELGRIGMLAEPDEIDYGHVGSQKSEDKGEKSPKAFEFQTSMFSFGEHPIIEKLRKLNLMELTPSQAFKLLEEMKEAVENE